MNCATRFHQRIVEQSRSIPPEQVAGWLISHGLLGISDGAGLAPPVRDELRREQRRNVAANLQRVREFQLVCQAAGELPICPLKGIYLIDRIYRDEPGMRYLRDIDLLVPAAHEGALIDRLAGRLGFSAEGEPGPRSTHDRRLTGASGALLDLHTRLAFKHGAASTWSDLCPAPGTVHGVAVRVLDAETTLVHLVTHLVRHGPLARLGWIEDIVRWIDLGVDSRRALDVATRLGAERSFLAGVRVLRRLVAGDLLPGLDSRLSGADRLMKWNERIVWQWAGDPTSPRPAGRLERNLTPLLLADSPLDAWRVARVKLAEVWHRNLRRGGP